MSINVVQQHLVLRGVGSNPTLIMTLAFFFPCLAQSYVSSSTFPAEMRHFLVFQNSQAQPTSPQLLGSCCPKIPALRFSRFVCLSHILVVPFSDDHLL